MDPWKPVDRAVITHAHSDHARWGSKNYLCSVTGKEVLRERLGNVQIEAIPYGEKISMNGVAVSLHPAGHLLGSAQVRVEHRGEVWVASGDYKTQPDRTCEPFEVVRCNTFITESTFGLPIYRWRPETELFADLNDWWRANGERGWTSILFAYSLGKAQRVLGGIDPSIGPILVHGSIPRLNAAYARGGIQLPEAHHAQAENAKSAKGRALVIAPPSVGDSPWLKKFAPYSLAMASGWMQIRGTRRRRAMDRGFALSDHADWQGLLDTIKATGAETIGVTHGYTAPMVRWLQEQGWSAFRLPTLFEGEGDTEVEGPEEAEAILEDEKRRPNE
ncbi:ligase-associated DNA damage response exonuclease [soil metagenome]